MLSRYGPEIFPGVVLAQRPRRATSADETEAGEDTPDPADRPPAGRLSRSGEEAAPRRAGEPAADL